MKKDKIKKQKIDKWNIATTEDVKSVTLLSKETCENHTRWGKSKESE